MNSVEDAYSSISESMVTAAEVDGWCRLELHATLYTTMVRSKFVVILAGGVDETKYVTSIIDACIFLRDHLLKTTGQRIYGLTFTLTPDGKFTLDYDYERPADYDDSGETISLEEALGSLGQAGITANPAEDDTPEHRFLAAAVTRL